MVRVNSSGIPKIKMKPNNKFTLSRPNFYHNDSSSFLTGVEQKNLQLSPISLFKKKNLQKVASFRHREILRCYQCLSYIKQHFLPLQVLWSTYWHNTELKIQLEMPCQEVVINLHFILPQVGDPQPTAATLTL